MMILAIIRTSLPYKLGYKDPNNKGTGMSMRILKSDGRLNRIVKRLGGKRINFGHRAIEKKLASGFGYEIWYRAM
jgi:hypothetical protein